MKVSLIPLLSMKSYPLSANFLNSIIKIRMHSSRMPSAGGGGCLPRWVCLRRGVSIFCMGVYTSHHCGQTDTCEKITFPKLLLRTIKTCLVSMDDQSENRKMLQPTRSSSFPVIHKVCIAYVQKSKIISVKKVSPVGIEPVTLGF